MIAEFVDERNFAVPDTTKSPWKIWDILPGHQIGDVESPGFCFRRSSRSQLMGMFGLIEFSELVARYSEGKSQGLSFCQVLNLPVRNGSDNGCIWNLRTWRNILTTKS